jgi:hypothetical protein
MKRSMSGAICALVATCFVASTASAEIYRWVDESGHRHLTNELYEVPAQYREAALADLQREGGSLNVIHEGSAAPAKSARSGASSPPAAAPAGGAETFEGHDEGWWRSQAMGLERSAEVSRADYEAAVEQADDEVEVGRIPGTGTRNAVNSRRRIHRNRAPRLAAMDSEDSDDLTLEELERRADASDRELEDFHEQARRAGVPPGWLR